MFTGIVEEKGTIDSVSLTSKGGSLKINASTVLKDTQIGDSICVNGVCLTVTKISSSSFTADVMAETLRKTNLGNLSKGSQVNLERAMPANGRFGGHIVSGHIDGTGTVKSLKKEGNAIWFEVETSQEILNLIIIKGSITIDGTSLTVAKLSPTSFSVSLIPHTLSNTILMNKKAGDTVNLENDILAKYVEKLLYKTNSENTQNKDKLFMEFLEE